MVAKNSGAAENQAPVVDTSDWSEANINIDAWYDPEKSGKILGRVLEAIRINTAFGEQDVVKVRLGAPTKALQGKGDDAKVVDLAAGQVIAVRVSMNLTILLELVANQCAVEITPKGKKKTSSNRQIWTYGVKYKGQRQPLSTKPATQEVPENAQAPDDDDTIPF